MQPASCRSVHQTACHFPPERAGILRDYPPCAGIFLSGKHRGRLQFLCRQTDSSDLPDNACHLASCVEISYPAGREAFCPDAALYAAYHKRCGWELIDRVSRNYVVDFIYFVPIDFPKFNVADIYITVGVAVLAVLLFFYYTDEELEPLLTLRAKNSPD